MEKWNLPDGWEWIQLGNLCTLTGGGTPDRSNSSYFDGDIVWITPTDIVSSTLIPTIRDSKTKITDEGSRRSSAKLVKEGTVLFSSRATIGKIAIAGIPLATNQGFANFTCSDKLYNRYLAWALKALTENIKGLASSAVYLEINRTKFREFSIPIPYPDEPTRSLETQRRIVARLEALLAEVQETRQLRCSILDDANLLGRAIFFRGEWEATMQRMGEIVSQKPLDVIVNNETEYLFAGVKSFGRGVFPSKSKKGFETSYRQLTRLSTGDFTYPKLMAWEGALGIVSPECDGMVVSPEFPVFQVHTNKILPEVLDVYFKTPSIWERLAALSTGSNARRRRLHPNAFLDYEFPVPPKHIQQQIHEAHVFLTEYKKSYNDDENSLGILEQTFLAQAFRGEL